MLQKVKDESLIKYLNEYFCVWFDMLFPEQSNMKPTILDFMLDYLNGSDAVRSRIKWYIQNILKPSDKKWNTDTWATSLNSEIAAYREANMSKYK